MDTHNRNKSDTENVLEKRQLVNEIESILLEYGYPLEQIEYEVPLRTDTERKTDLIVFDKQKSALIVIEIKKTIQESMK